MRIFIAAFILLASLAAAEVYVIEFEYSKGALAAKKVYVSPGTSEDAFEPGDGYTLKLLDSQGDLLKFRRFHVPDREFFDNYEINETAGGFRKVSETRFGVLLPYKEEGVTIQLLSPDGEAIQRIDVARFAKLAERRKAAFRKEEFPVIPVAGGLILAILAAVAAFSWWKRREREKEEYVESLVGPRENF
jgi:hypothetical protein